MKINGKEINHYASKKLTFNRADGNSIELIVRSIPLGWQRKYEEVYPRPSAPTLVVATNASQDVKTNFTDPAFVKAISDWDKKETFFLVWLLIKDTPGLSFTSPPTNRESFDKFIDELSASGISEIELVAIAQAGREISNPSAEEVGKARENFTAK